MNYQSIRNQRSLLVPFFVLTFTISWGLAAFLLFFPEQMEPIFGAISMANPIFILAVAGPTIAATLLTYRQKGWAGLRDLYSGILTWRFGIQWYAAVLIGLPAIAYLISRLVGPEPAADLSTPGLLLLFLLNQLILGPLGEEFGWRGFALPRLLVRFNPFVASLILGVIWGIWHFPSFFMSGVPQSSLSVSLFLFGALCLSVLATWLFLHTDGSLLIVVLFHLMINISMEAFGTPFPPFVLVLTIIVMLVLALDRGMGWFHHRGSTPTVSNVGTTNGQQPKGVRGV